MPGKTAKSAPLPPFGLSGMTALVRAATLSCENAGKSQKCTQGESRLRPLSRSQKPDTVAKSKISAACYDDSEGLALGVQCYEIPAQ
jgi:hypothetical protein